MNKKLYRDEYHKVLGGVCSGLAEYFEMDVTIVRLLFALTFFIMGAGLGTYIILWIVLPRKGYPYNNFNHQTVDYTVPPQNYNNQFNTPPPPVNPFGSDPFGKSFGGDTYTGSTFGNNPPPIAPPRQKSHAGIIIGLVLIFVGAAILIDEYDLIPDFDFDRVWPAVLILIGASLIVAGQKKQPWEKHEWPKTDINEQPATEVQPETDSPSTL